MMATVMTRDKEVARLIQLAAKSGIKDDGLHSAIEEYFTAPCKLLLLSFNHN